MKKGFVRDELKQVNKAEVQQLQIDEHPFGPYNGLLQLLADIADTAIGGADVFASFGISRDRGSVLLTVKVDGHPLYAGGRSLKEVSDACLELLD